MTRVINMVQGRELIVINKDKTYSTKAIVEIAVEDRDIYLYTNDGEKIIITPSTLIAQDGWSRRREYMEYMERMYVLLFSERIYSFNNNIYTSADGILYRNREMADGHKEVAFI